MNIDTDMQAPKEISRGEKGRSEPVLSTLTEKIGSLARASTVYGEPIEHGEVTVVPVAKAWWGVIGGDGKEGENAGAIGGGGGVKVTPTGFIEISNGRVRYRSIFDFSSIVQMILAGGFASALILHGVRRIIEASRPKKIYL